MISVKNLKRNFGPITAVDDVSFDVGKGEVLGFLGPNGAGKSTTMKILACFLPPDSGTASVCGHDILADPIKVRQSLGYLAEHAPAYGEMTVASFLHFICDARGICGKARKEAIDRIVSMCSINSVYHQSIETLSKGYCRRLGLAQALIHDPDVLILDEPCVGLDPAARRRVVGDRTQLAGQTGSPTMILVTHHIEEIGPWIEHILLLKEGRCLGQGVKREMLTGPLLSQAFGRTAEVAKNGGYYRLELK